MRRALRIPLLIAAATTTMLPAAGPVAAQDAASATTEASTTAATYHLVGKYKYQKECLDRGKEGLLAGRWRHYYCEWSCCGWNGRYFYVQYELWALY